MLAAVTVLALLSACGDSKESQSTPVPPVAEETPVSGNPAPLNPPTLPATNEPAPTGTLPRLRLERVFPSLGFARMTGLYQAPDGRFFVLEQTGRILVFENRNDVTQAQVFLDIRDRVDASGAEMGLLGMALAPDFAQSGNFYLNYNAGSPRRTVIARFNVPAGRTQADPASQSIILEVAQPFSNHNGGQTSFGPDGFLYIAFGDGGSQGDPMRNGQNLNALLGKILRIDVSGTSGNRNYRVPSDNPFVGRADTREEVWAYGFRNPWRFSFDLQTGQLWAGDVGAAAVEEVDLVRRGENYGWNIMEGNRCMGGGSCDRNGLTLPVHEYPRAGGNCSITGGFIYRGQAIPSLRGAYVYSDYCSGQISGFRYDGTEATDQGTLIQGAFPISSFAQGNDGELYVLGYANSGGIYKIVQ